ncbi:DUF3846 domain-containing protein [Halomonas sp. 707B3]|uniref:DUF3846 domain-containing protein n=1 Tax=Halomonas sp. 707B3 TaxID=1681043 RepID=UPI00209EA5CB|nr:DUF3846 domain-containing protein [Halomonas sp. 707B3]MCP1316870.1 DUF3846 domain-containing protein [Halomonas sp. 707B3]
MSQQIRALLIIGSTVAVTTLDTKDTLADMRKVINCDIVTGAGYPDEHHAAWVDDEGLVSGAAVVPLTEVRWYPQPLAGAILITGFDPDTGDTTPAMMAVEEARQHITGTSFLVRDYD